MHTQTMKSKTESSKTNWRAQLHLSRSVYCSWIRYNVTSHQHLDEIQLATLKNWRKWFPKYRYFDIYVRKIHGSSSPTNQLGFTREKMFWNQCNLCSLQLWIVLRAFNGRYYIFILYSCVRKKLNRDQFL